MSALVRLVPVSVLVGSLLACNQLTVPLLPVLADPCAEWPEPGMYRLNVGDEWTRTPLVYVPPSPPASRREAVVMLHGAGGSPEKMELLTLWQARAVDRSLLAVFPSGTGGTGGLTWNAGSCCGYAENIDQPDVAFLDATAAALRDQLCVDKVLAAGHSNGSMMAQRWTCEGSGVDAVIANAGPLLLNTCKGEPVPVQAWVGDADPRVPPAGGTTDEGETFPPAEEAFALVRARNQCTDEAPRVTVTGDLTCSTWSCAASTVFCVVAGGEHDWPGGVADRGDNPVIEDVALAWFDEVTAEVSDTDVADTDVNDTDVTAPADTDPADTDPADTDPADTDPVDTTDTTDTTNPGDTVDTTDTVAP
jgi:polyhydroxybutyrate depolymerase